MVTGMPSTQSSIPPLEDPNYDPIHKPVDGRPPAVVAKWGSASQLRWFRRFWGDLVPMKESELADFYCESGQHKGLCCISCVQEQYDGYAYTEGCCCRAVLDD